MEKGEKYNRLTAVRFDHRRGRHLYWLFKCSCGNKRVVRVDKVKSGHTKSCGCLLRETVSKIMTTHGMSYSKEYSAWEHMKRRCLNPNERHYKDYGGRGITICKSWMKFENFYTNMGKCPEGKSIDRIDNNGNYEPLNCRWATQKEQCNNTRRNHLLTFNGKTQDITQWTKELKFKRGNIYNRLKRGWSVEKALATPVG